MSMQDLCPMIDAALNLDPDNPEYGYTIIICQMDGSLIGGETALLTNMNARAAIDLIHMASEHLAEEEDSVAGPQRKGN